MLEHYAWLQPVLIAAAVVFVLDLIGNMLSFSNRVLNAFVTALVFAVLFGALIQAGVVQLDVKTVPLSTEAPAPAQ